MIDSFTPVVAISFEVWAAKGNTPLRIFGSCAHAREWMQDREHVVPGLRLFESTRTRRQLDTGPVSVPA